MTAIYILMITVMAIIIFGGVLSILLTAAFVSDKVEHDEMFSQGSWDDELLHLNHSPQPIDDTKS
ncbi:hypothetical protein ACFO4U_12650 [Exiguobacterium profundum]|jgi:hypothetical protein|uniref:Tumour necrosis factor receptor superfamily member 19 n=3 Tax=Exiguobacterium TaxID=33986 RepID=C4L332_EXISA|nr:MULTISPECIES: hypothetical protein [Exiguobacterium]MCC9626283.1 hypothetical protein [Thalassospira sp. MA62]QPI67117.1 hypothetical protein IR194_11760 [Exiguobacterium sp. PBE]ACQ71306.1 hypothetical protein EAT1b_2385 [Exiguobacterium sp. AT1b]MBG0918517.1 hypothetical protein [Exiguobacterium sp. SRB7LM]MBQ6459579.1 hypothetical protein [Exiguobacterium sp.]